jgi:AAHS family 3-hydroxyphenylpropionic acid transporter
MNGSTQTRGPAATSTIALCFAVAVLEGFDIQAMGVAAPKLAPEFGLPPEQLGRLFAISNVGLVFGASFGGWLADRWGRKPVFLTSVLTFSTFTLLTAVAGGYQGLFAARLGAGLGFGAALPNMMAVAADISHPGKRASTAATMFGGMPLGGGLSALLTQVLPPGVDWRIIFMVGGTLPLVVAAALYFLMQETRTSTERARGARTPVLVALFHEGRAWPSVLLWLAFLPTLVILYLLLNWLPTLVIANGLDLAIAPQASLAFNFASVAGALIIGRLVDRFGTRLFLAGAYALLILVVIALSNARELAPMLVLSGAAGFLLLGASYALHGVAASYYPSNVRGTGSGASIAVGRVGSIAGPLLAGVLLGSGATAASVVLYLAPFAAIAGVAVLLLSYFRPVD